MSVAARVAVIDNYDSFTYNLVQLLAALALAERLAPEGVP